MCDQQSLRSACAYAQPDQSLCLSLEYSMIVKLLTEHILGFLSLKGGCRGSSESTHVKMSHCWKSHALAQMSESDTSILVDNSIDSDLETYINKLHVLAVAVVIHLFICYILVIWRRIDHTHTHARTHARKHARTQNAFMSVLCSFYPFQNVVWIFS